ncbi:MAG: response regulator [Cellvibrio sp.]
MKKILIVEDSEVVIKVMRHLLLQYPQYQAVFATTKTQAEAAIKEYRNDIFVALVDLNLPDSPDGYVVDYVLAQKLPVIVLTGSYDEQKREQLFSKGIVDYVMKEGRLAYEKAIRLIERLEKNQHIKVLVVDDSDATLKHLGHLFRQHLFQVIEATDGVEAVKMLLENPDVKLLVTDYNMPRMDGFELVKNLRYKYNKTDLIIIGLSGESSETLSAKFLKQGANDFLRKPFLPEEFYCRIIHNLEYMELVNEIASATQRDHLTGLFHRHHFFNASQELYLHAQEKATPLALAVINIDNFREFNENFGHEGGDQVLVQVARNLSQMLERFLLCRAEGDCFYVLLPGLDNEKAVALISRIRQLLSAEACLIKGESKRIYFSAGISNKSEGGADQQIKFATHLLKLGKEAGGNMVLGDDDDEMDN